MLDPQYFIIGAIFLFVVIKLYTWYNGRENMPNAQSKYENEKVDTAYSDEEEEREEMNTGRSTNNNTEEEINEENGNDEPTEGEQAYESEDESDTEERKNQPERCDSCGNKFFKTSDGHTYVSCAECGKSVCFNCGMWFDNAKIGLCNKCMKKEALSPEKTTEPMIDETEFDKVW